MKTPILEQLLIDPQSVDLPTGVMGQDGMDNVRVWIRRLTQVERDLCTGYARRASREMRKDLENPDSERRHILVDDEIDEYELESLRQAYVNGKLIERAIAINRQSLEDRDETYVSEPDGDVVLPEEIERYENSVEDVEEQREKGVRDAIEAAIVQLREEARNMDEEALKADATPTTINAICADVYTREYIAQMICRATFSDKELTKPAFKTPREVDRLAPSVLETLAKAHEALLIDPEAIKNLAGNQK